MIEPMIYAKEMEDRECKECETENCDFCRSRTEAIIRMAKAMCRFDCEDFELECENCNKWEKYDKMEDLAEVALNALVKEV